MQDLLSQVKNNISSKISNLNYSTWFGPIKEAKAEDEVFTLLVPNKFVADWISDYYHELILQELFTITGHSWRLNFEIQEGSGGAKLRSPNITSEPNVEGRSAVEANTFQHRMASPPPKARTLASLNAKYNFDSFVVGSSNQFAHAACKAAAEFPGGRYNPLFLYGGVGLGKTHLAQAIGNEIAHRHPNLSILYVSSERFMNELINAIRFEKTDSFRKKFRESCDVLLIDDIQFIAGKERTQDEFFHTFNTLYEGQKQIVMTSDKFPKDIQGLEERLRSRFEWGLIADIQPPDFETRVAILKKKADEEGLSCPDDVAMFLASSIKSNVRELEGSLIRINAFASLTNAPVGVDLTKEVLRNIVHEQDRSCSIESIQKTVASYYKVNISDLKSPRRVKVFAHPRQVAMYLCKKLSGSSFPEIGDKFGGKDHTTVMHACKKIERLLKDDSTLQGDIASLEQNLQH